MKCLVLVAFCLNKKARLDTCNPKRTSSSRVAWEPIIASSYQKNILPSTSPYRRQVRKIKIERVSEEKCPQPPPPPTGIAHPQANDETDIASTTTNPQSNHPTNHPSHP